MGSEAVKSQRSSRRAEKTSAAKAEKAKLAESFDVQEQEE